MSAATKDAQRDLERAALGTVLLKGGQWLLSSELEADHFCGPAHRAIWSAMCQLGADGEEVDTINVRQVLQDHGRLRQVGGDEYLLGLTDDLPTGMTDLQLRRLKELARVRELESVAKGVLAAADEGDITKTLQAVTQLSETASHAAPNRRSYDMRGLMGLVVEHLTAPAEKVMSIYPGTPRLQHFLGGLPVGSLMIIAADTGVGKTSKAYAMAMGLAERGVPVGVVSLEDGALLTATRFLALYTRQLSSRFVLQRRLGEHESGAAIHAAGKVAEMPVHFEECVAGSDVDVLMAMARLKAQGCRMVIVDYAQEVHSHDKLDRRIEVGRVAGRIKAQGAKLGMATVLLSQLSRPKERAHREPTKWDLKESGDLENKCEVLLMLWREEERDDAPVHAKLAKVKWGGTGARWVERRDASGSLREVDERPEHVAMDRTGDLDDDV